MRKLCGIAIVMGAWLLWPSRDYKLDLDAGTTYDHFAVLDRERGSITEITQSGKRVREVGTKAIADSRVVGTQHTTGLVWVAGKRVVLAPVDYDHEQQKFGKRVEKLCAGTATTHLTFAVGWLERDGSIWILRGGSRVAELVAPGTIDMESTASPYCGVGRNDLGLALLYRDGNRTELLRCPEDKKCGNPRKVSLDGRDTILGFSCTMSYCLIATRSRDNTTTLHWLDDKARTITKRELASCKDGAVNVSGEGNRFAIAYSTGPDPIVELSDAPGQLRQIYAGGESNFTPSLTWMGNVLLIAVQRGRELVWETQIL